SEKPKYKFPAIPPYSLIVISFISLGVGTLVSSDLTFKQLGQKFLVISSTAISVDIALCIRHRRFGNFALALAILILNLLYQSVSGWKGEILWTVITLGALLYPIMPKRVVLGGGAFVIFWALYFYPFGLALRPLLWYEGVARGEAIRISLDKAMDMSLEQRLD